MNRREMLTSAAAILATATVGNVFAAESNKMDMGSVDMSHGHDHHKSSRNQKLIEAASDCVLKAEICLQHCLVSLGKGEKELAACAHIVSQVGAVCAALQQMASAESKHLPQLAKVVMDVCKECEEECKKTDKHPECKACGESCAACAKECQAIAA